MPLDDLETNQIALIGVPWLQWEVGQRLIRQLLERGWGLGGEDTPEFAPFRVARENIARYSKASKGSEVCNGGEIDRIE